MENAVLFWEQLLELRWHSNEDSYSADSEELQKMF